MLRRLSMTFFCVNTIVSGLAFLRRATILGFGLL
jgi:hypothetical protein